MIAASELIITPQGKIYHLNVSKDDIADTIITVGDPDRVCEISKYFDKITFKTQHREFVTHTGYIGKKNITVLSSGIGPDNIDIVMNELDAVANIDFSTREPYQQKSSLKIIRFGTSGSLQAHIPVDSLVASSFGIGLDNVLHYYCLENTELEKEILEQFILHTQLQHTAIMPYIAQGSQVLLQAFHSGFHRGITVTCPGFYAPQGRKLRAPLQFPHLVDTFNSFHHKDYLITNFEMETSAIFGLGKIFNHQCLAINTIVANRISKTFSTDTKKSVENMIKKGLEIIEHI